MSLSELTMGLSNLIETVLLLVVCVVLPSALAMYFSIPPKSGTEPQ